MAIRFESAARRARSTARRWSARAARRGLEIIVLALSVSPAGVRPRRLLGLARPLPRRHPELHRRVDVGGGVHHRAAPRAAGRSSRPCWRRRPCIALGPIIGPTHFPVCLPRPLTSYLGGERPMAWFPLFPSLAWPLVGVLRRSLLGAAERDRAQAGDRVRHHRRGRRSADDCAVMMVRALQPVHHPLPVGPGAADGAGDVLLPPRADRAAGAAGLPGDADLPAPAVLADAASSGRRRCSSTGFTSSSSTACCSAGCTTG